MFQQKATETVTLTRTQLQAILELITQIGGISRSDSRNETKTSFRNDNKITFNNVNESQYKDNQLIDVNNHWERDREDLLARSDWYSHNLNAQQANRYSSLVMANENQLSSPTLSESSKVDDLRVNSVLTNETSHSNESNFRRYARINDSEFDWNALHQKRLKALEYSRALALQHEEKQRKKLEEQQKIRDEEQLLEKRLEQQRMRMKSDYDMEQNLLEEKRLLAERKREAVIEAIERTPIIKKRNFLVDKSPEPQPPVVTIATIKPQTITDEKSSQTDGQRVGPQYRETGTQTDVQLLLQLLSEMNVMSKSLSKSVETLSSDPNSSVRAKTQQKKWSQTKSDPKTFVTKRPVWAKSQQSKANLKNTDVLNQKSSESEKKCEEIEVKSDIKIENKEKPKNETNGRTDGIDGQMNAFRRNSLTFSSSYKNKSEFNTNRIMSSTDPNTKLNFLPKIDGRPHSRKKWYSQHTFDPNFFS